MHMQQSEDVWMCALRRLSGRKERGGKAREKGTKEKGGSRGEEAKGGGGGCGGGGGGAVKLKGEKGKERRTIGQKGRASE